MAKNPILLAIIATKGNNKRLSHLVNNNIQERRDYISSAVKVALAHVQLRALKRCRYGACAWTHALKHRLLVRHALHTHHVEMGKSYEREGVRTALYIRRPRKS